MTKRRFSCDRPARSGILSAGAMGLFVCCLLLPCAGQSFSPPTPFTLFTFQIKNYLNTKASPELFLPLFSPQSPRVCVGTTFWMVWRRAMTEIISLGTAARPTAQWSPTLSAAKCLARACATRSAKFFRQITTLNCIQLSPFFSRVLLKRMFGLAALSF